MQDGLPHILVGCGSVTLLHDFLLGYAKVGAIGCHCAVVSHIMSTKPISFLCSLMRSNIGIATESQAIITLTPKKCHNLCSPHPNPDSQWHRWGNAQAQTHLRSHYPSQQHDQLQTFLRNDAMKRTTEITFNQSSCYWYQFGYDMTTTTTTTAGGMNWRESDSYIFW